MSSKAAVIAAAVVTLFGAVPWRVRIRLGQILGGIVATLPHRDARIAELQLDRFLPSSVRRPALSEVYAHLGRTVLESLSLSPATLMQAGAITLPVQTLTALRSEARGIVALSAHIGNWELLAATMVQQGFDLTLIAREARSAVGQAIIERIRRNYGAKVIWRIDGSGTKEIIRVLERGGAIAALIDQDTEVSSIESTFFGASVKTPHALIKLAQRRQAEIVAAFIARTAHDNSEIFLYRLNREAPVEEILAEYHRHLENLICRFPAQWVWVHKRWRSIGDKRFSSREYIEFLEQRP